MHKYCSLTFDDFVTKGIATKKVIRPRRYTFEIVKNVTINNTTIIPARNSLNIVRYLPTKTEMLMQKIGINISNKTNMSILLKSTFLQV